MHFLSKESNKKQDMELTEVLSNYYFLLHKLKLWITKLIPLSWKNNLKFPGFCFERIKELTGNY